MKSIKNNCININGEDFFFHNIKDIDSIYYYKDYNDCAEKIIRLDIKCCLYNQSNAINVVIKFENVSKVHFGENFIACFGLDIEDMLNLGWSNDIRYHITDHEEDTFDFYCQEIKVVFNGIEY